MVAKFAIPGAATLTSVENPLEPIFGSSSVVLVERAFKLADNVFALIFRPREKDSPPAVFQV